MHHKFFNVAHPLFALSEREKATLSRLTPTKSAQQGASSTPLGVMDAGWTRFWARSERFRHFARDANGRIHTARRRRQPA